MNGKRILGQWIDRLGIGLVVGGVVKGIENLQVNLALSLILIILGAFVAALGVYVAEKN